MGLTNETLPLIYNCFKFNSQVLNMIKTSKIKKIEVFPYYNNYYKKMKEFRGEIKKIKKFFKPPISQDIIKLFYENPNEFFNSYEQLIENTSFYDDGGNSIFAHYFYVLHDLYKYKKSKIKDNIYEKNFNSFFQKEAKYLSIQDFSFETPLHKLVKFNNKIFFFEICKKLKDINVLNEELLLINNVEGKSCFDHIIKEIIENTNKIIKKDFEIYNNFLSTNNSIIKSLPKEIQNDLYLFSSLINFEQKYFKDIKFNDISTGLNNLFQKFKERINEFFNPDINYLNCLFHFSKSNKDFDDTFKFLLKLSDPELNEINKNKKNKYIPIHKYIYKHIGYVLRKMKINNKNYTMKLIKEILPNLLLNNEFDEFKDKELLRKIKIQFKINSLGFNLAKNPYLNFSQKCEILKSLEKELKEHFDEVSDEDIMYLYKLFKLYNKKNR